MRNLFLSKIFPSILLLSLFFLFSLSPHSFASTNSSKEKEDLEILLLSQKKKSGESLEESSNDPSSFHKTSQVSGNLNNLKELLEKDLPENEICPLPFLHHYMDTIHYYYRLLSLSFLYEAIEDYEECAVNWENFLEKECLGKSEDMKLFIKRAKVFLKRDHLSKKEKNKDQLIEKNSIRKIRLSEFGGDLSKIKLICQEDLNLFKKICSEDDAFYAYSEIPEMTQILVKSHTIKIIDDKGRGEGCLKRFLSFYKDDEEKLSYLPNLYRGVSDKLKSTKTNVYQEGYLFLPGSLREFDTKGLTNFIFKETSSTPLIITKVTVDNKKPKAQKTKKIPLVKKTTPQPPPPPISEPPKEALPLLSAFNKALQSFNEKHEESAVNMDDFKKDYIFTQEQVERLGPKLEAYSQLKALKEMKNFDQLGEKSLPLSLFFIKFLIDKKIHQSLFNLCQVFGEKFYIINDLESSKDAVFIKLHYDKNSRSWKIFILDLDKNPKK